MRTLWTGDGIVGTLAVGIVSVALLGVVWLVLTGLSVLIIGRAALLLSPILTLGVAVVGIYYGYSGGTFSLQEAGYLLAMGLVTVVFLIVIFFISYLLLALAFVPTGVALGAAAAVTLGVALLCLVGLLATVRDRDEGTNWALNLRMTVAMVLLGFCGIGLFGVAWFVASFAGSFVFSPDVAIAVAPLGALAVLAILARMEYRQILTVEDRANATVVTEADYPELYGRSRRIAAQLDVPAPTVAVAERPTPEAMVVGFRPSNTHLICSTGLVDALDDEELDAVIAHELAHVANRDAMVMTVVSAPVVIVDRFISWDSEDEDETEAYGDDSVSDTGLTEAELYCADGEWAIGQNSVETSARNEDDDSDAPNILKPVVFVVLGLSRAIVSVLSRTRETVADRTAAQVTGSPAALASALQTLDRRVEAVPDEDLRETAGVATLSIVPLDPAGVVDGEETADGLTGRIKHWMFSTHPSVETRLEKLGSMEKRQ